MDGLGKRAYDEIDKLCRGVMRGEIQLPKRPTSSSRSRKKSSSRGGTQRSPMELEWMKIVGPENFDEKLKFCKKVEEVVTVEMCFQVK